MEKEEVMPTVEEVSGDKLMSKDQADWFRWVFSIVLLGLLPAFLMAIYWINFKPNEINLLIIALLYLIPATVLILPSLRSEK